MTNGGSVPIKRHLALATVAIAALLTPSYAADNGRVKFAWPLAREHTLFAAPENS
jgi:hypothetical protein